MVCMKVALMVEQTVAGKAVKTVDQEAAMWAAVTAFETVASKAVSKAVSLVGNLVV